MIEIGVFHNGASDLPGGANVLGSGHQRRQPRRGSRSQPARIGCSGAAGNPRRQARFQLLLHDRAPFSARRRGVQPQSAPCRDGDRLAHAPDSAWSGSQHRYVVASDSNCGASRDARRDQQWSPRIRNWPRVSTTRGRGFRMAVRDHPGPGAQPRVLPGSLRDHHQGVDAAVVLASRAVLHDSAGVHAMEPSADDRVLRIRQGGTKARRGAQHRRA